MDAAPFSVPAVVFWSRKNGGKNSSVGKSMRLNMSQGLSDVEPVHSFSGMQKSYVGISICTLRTICTMVNSPTAI